MAKLWVSEWITPRGQNGRSGRSGRSHDARQRRGTALLSPTFYNQTLWRLFSPFGAFQEGLMRSTCLSPAGNCINSPPKHSVHTRDTNTNVMPHDPVAAAVQLLKKQITPQKSPTEINVDYAGLLARYPSERSHVVQLICCEPELYNAIDNTRHHLIHSNAKLRASYNILCKHNVAWPKLDVAFGHSAWSRSSFLDKVKQLIVDGASFDLVVQLITTAKDTRRGATFEPRDATQALQEYTDRAHRQSQTDDQDPASHEDRAPKRCRTGSPAGSSPCSPATDSEVEIERARAHPTTSRGDTSNDDSLYGGVTDDSFVNTPRIHTASDSGTRAKTVSDNGLWDDSTRNDGISDNDISHNITGDHIDDLGDNASIAMSDLADVSDVITGAALEDAVKTLQKVRRHVCKANDRLTEARAELEAAYQRAKEVEREYRRMLCQDDDAAVNVPEIQSAKGRVAAANTEVDHVHEKEKDAKKDRDEAQAFWLQLCELTLWPIERGPDLPGA